MEAPVNEVPGRPVKVRALAGANYDPTIDVAFICTGNICRSPMAEVLLRARLATVAPEVVVGSAGLLFDDRPAERRAAKAMAKQGLDLSAHRSQKISVDLLGDTSLILGMERGHVREVAALDPALFARSFTLPELAMAVELVGYRPAELDLRSWVEHIGRVRSLESYSASDPYSEIADPMGGSSRTFRTCAQTIDGHLATLVAHAWPTPELGDPPVAPANGGIHADRDRR